MQIDCIAAVVQMLHNQQDANDHKMETKQNINVLENTSIGKICFNGTSILKEKLGWFLNSNQDFYKRKNIFKKKIINNNN